MRDTGEYHLTSSQHQALLSPRHAALLWRAIPTLDALRQIQQTESTIIRQLCDAVIAYESNVAASHPEVNIRGAQFLGGGHRHAQPNQSEQGYVTDWTTGFLDSFALMRERVPSYAAAVADYEMMMRDETTVARRIVVAKIVTARAADIYQPAFMFEALRREGIDARSLGEMEAGVQFRHLLRVLFGRYSSGTTPQSSRFWPHRIPTHKIDPARLNEPAHDKPRHPNLAFFSRRRNLGYQLMHQVNAEPALWDCDNQLAMLFYLKMLSSRTGFPEPAVLKLYDDKMLLMRGYPDVDRFIAEAIQEHGTLAAAIRQHRADTQRWQQQGGKREILKYMKREERLLRLMHDPTLCLMNDQRGYQYVGPSLIDETNPKKIIRWFFDAKVNDFINPGDVAEDWNIYHAQHRHVRQKLSAVRKLTTEESFIAQRHHDLAAFDREKVPDALIEEWKQLSPERARIERARYDRARKKKRESIEKSIARAQQRVDLKRQRAVELAKPVEDPIALRAPVAEQMRARLERQRLATEREIALRAERVEQERVKNLEKMAAKQAQHDKRIAVARQIVKPKKKPQKKPYVIWASQWDEMRARHARRQYRQQQQNKNKRDPSPG